MPILETLLPIAANAIFGMGLNDPRQLAQQGRLQKQEIAGQKQMMDYSYKKQLEMWNATNYSEQIKQLTKAGLNPGLLYGMGGAGGATTGTPTGNVTGAHAPAGGGEVGMGISMALLEAQRANIEADTEKKKVEAAKMSGVDTEQVKAATGLTNAQKAFQEVQTRFANMSFNARLDEIDRTVENLIQEAKGKNQRNEIDKQTLDTQIQQIKDQARGVALENTLKEVQIEAARKGIEVSNAEMAKWKRELEIASEELAVKQNDLKLRAAVESIKANNPSIWNVAGSILKRFENGLDEMFGSKRAQQNTLIPQFK